MDLIESIGMGELINCILVMKDARSAWMIEPSNYGEATPFDPKTRSKIEAMRRAFPDLIFTHLPHLNNYVLVSKRAYHDVISFAQVGHILGFPSKCVDEYDSLDRSKESTASYSIVVTMENGSEYEVIAFVCRLEHTQDAANTARAELYFAALRDSILAPLIRDVRSNVRIYHPVRYFIQKLVAHEPISAADDAEIMNYIYNMYASWDDTFQYTNPVHVGIVLSLLAQYEYTEISPFFPLQFRPEKASVDAITLNLTRLLSSILKNTRS